MQARLVGLARSMSSAGKEKSEKTLVAFIYHSVGVWARGVRRGGLGEDGFLVAIY